MNTILRNVLLECASHARALTTRMAALRFYPLAGTLSIWLFLAAASADPVLIDLRDTPADATIYPEHRKSYGGLAIATGDLDGNGIDEIIIGSPFALGERGRVHIIFNPPMDTVPAVWDLAAPPAGLQVTTILGEQKNDWFGYSLAVGDYNNDGRDDLAVGAPNAMDPLLRRPLAGSVCVFARLLPGNHDIGSADITLHGAGENDGAGTELALGDLNGDGVDDLVIAAPFGNVKKTRQYIERAYVSYGGSTRQRGQILDLERDYDVLLLHGSALFYSSVNSSAYTIRDIVGDGIPDLILGRQYSMEKYGYVHILRGAPHLSGTVLDMDEEADFVIKDSHRRDGLGPAVAAGDVDGDGDTDLVIGAPGAFSRTYGKIVLLLFNGTPDPASQVRIRMGDTTPFFEQIEIRGIEKRERLGQGLLVSDWNGDGVEDIAVGAVFGRDRSGDDAPGRVYILPGRQSWPGESTTIHTVPDMTAIIGARKGDEFGLALSVGDFGGGLSLLASAWLGDGPGNSRRDSGEVYVFSQGLLAGWLAPAALAPSPNGTSRAQDLYFLSRSWMEPTRQTRQWVDKSGDGFVGSEDVLMLHGQQRRPVAPR